MLSWVEIDKSALLHNLRSFRKLAGNATLLIPVVKSNAYGHGIAEVAHICDGSDDVDRLAVVNLDEALLLRLLNIKKPIQILSFFELDVQKISEAIKKNIIFPVYSLKYAEFLNSIGERIGIKCKVHIKIDTGTSRVGIKPEQIPEFAKKISTLKKIDIEGLWSHFSSSESDDKITKNQNSLIAESAEIFEKNGIKTPIIHIACTAAAVLHPNARRDAIRVGLGTYGLHPSPKTVGKIDLQPVLTWKTKIVQVKLVKKGERISYGGTYTMPKNGKIAVLPVGYYDGYDRAWSNKAHVLIKGVRCPVRGRVCMNLTMIDVSKLKSCEAGETVVLLGRDGKSTISADELAKLSPDTINYEVVTRINPSLPRIVV